MLKNLTVTNLAVVERAEVEFSSGLNVLTGETGAGKSVLMGALELVLGGRADSSIVRDGAKEARVEAIFELASLEAAISSILEDAGLPQCEGGQLIVRRLISSLGASRVWVNDVSTTVATLKKLGALLVDIHGPRANQQILEERFQRSTLDSYGHTSLNEYTAKWLELVDIRGKIAEIKALESSEDELDLLRYQVSECEEAHLTEEDETIAERHASAAHAEEILETANEVTDVLGGDGGVADSLARLQPKFNSLAKHLSDAESWASEAEDLIVRVNELSRAIMDSVSHLEIDSEEMAELDERLTIVNRLKRKYAKGGTISDLLAIIEGKKNKLAELENRDSILAELEEKASIIEKAVIKAGSALTKKRLVAGEKLAKAVTNELRNLGFLQAKFSVRISSCDPTSHGCDLVSYMFEPNPGESARELSMIASSGEIARVMLALKSVLAEHDAVGTLVFDEIDANIGGEVGRNVGEKMKAVSRHRQVIAITHLPQSAVYGNRHLVVSKAVSGGRTRTQIEVVDGEKRTAEISRMLGGGGKGGIASAHAEELLKQASEK